MASMCMETKLDMVTREFEEVEFCQSRPVETQEGWRLVRNPFRTLSRAGWGLYQMPKALLKRWVRSVGLCEQVLGRGVPILQRLGELMAAAGSGAYYITDKHHEAKLLQHSIERVRSIPITMETRMSFERAWGIDPLTQIEIEDTLKVEVCGHEVLCHDEAPFARSL